MRGKYKVLLGSIFLVSFIVIFTLDYSTINENNDLKSAATGDVQISSVSDKNVGDTFNTQIYVDSGSQKVGAYGFNITFNSNIVNVDGIIAGPDGITPISNIQNSNGWTMVTGFDANGVDAGTNLNFLTITWNAIAVGESVLAIKVINLVDETPINIGTPQGINSHVTVTSSDGIPGYNSLILFICVFSSIGVIYYFKVKRK